MRFSRLFARTLREAPADADVASHRLLVRAAFMRRLMAGVYTMLPLGFRTMRKVERIVREEMDAAGAEEMRMPIILPAEPWKATGRWDAYGEGTCTRSSGSIGTNAGPGSGCSAAGSS